MKLFFNNQVDIAIVSSDDANINYPATNVQDTRLSRFFRGDKSVNFDITGAGGIKNISQEYTNLLTDPTDLSTGNWTKTGTDVIDSGLTINDRVLWKLTSTTTAASFITGSYTPTANSAMISVLIKKGNTDTVSYDVTSSGTKGAIIIVFSTKTITPSSGAVVAGFTWIDDNTLNMWFNSAVMVAVPSTIRLFLDRDGSYVSGDYAYFSEPQIVDNTTTMFPFVDGTHSADVIDETFTMPDKFIVRLKNIEPRFAFDTSGSKWFLEWKGDSDSRLFLYYSPDDFIYVSWRDNGTLRKLASQQFDDGSSFTDINQKLDLVLFLNLSSGGINDSMFIVIPQESGSINIDNSFDGTPDTKSSTLSTLSIGYYPAGNSLQADSNYEAVQVYEWDGVKPTITSSEDVDDYLIDKKILLDKTYMKRLTATDLLIAKTTINAGDTITLRANDVDSFGPGSPVDESIDYDGSDILLHTFEEASYQRWRVIVNSSNIIDIGRVFLGLSYESPVVGWDVSHSYQSTTKKTRTPSLNTYGDIRPNENLISLKWPKILTATDKPALITFFNQVDISEPFFIIFDDGISKLGTLYVTIDGNGLHFVYYRNAVYSKAAISFIEEIG